MKKKLSVAKFGGSLLDVKGKGLPKILNRIKELKTQDSLGPVIVFSAPMGSTDELIRIGESYAQSTPLPLEPVFEIYNHMAKLHVKSTYRKQAQTEINNYKK